MEPYQPQMDSGNSVNKVAWIGETKLILSAIRLYIGMLFLLEEKKCLSNHVYT